MFTLELITHLSLVDGEMQKKGIGEAVIIDWKFGMGIHV
jgi:hypothetical protein